MPWVNLDELRRLIAEAASIAAKDAGIENPQVHVRIDLPDKKGRRPIEVQVTDWPKEAIEEIKGTKWEDN